MFPVERSRNHHSLWEAGPCSSEASVPCRAASPPPSVTAKQSGPSPGHGTAAGPHHGQCPAEPWVRPLLAGRVTRGPHSPAGRTHEEVEDCHVHDVQDAVAAVVGRCLLHLLAVVRVHLPPAGSQREPAGLCCADGEPGAPRGAQEKRCGRDPGVCRWTCLGRSAEAASVGAWVWEGTGSLYPAPG